MGDVELGGVLSVDMGCKYGMGSRGQIGDAVMEGPKVLELRENNFSWLQHHFVRWRRSLRAFRAPRRRDP